MTITNSPDITTLRVQAIFDLSLPTPEVRLVNLSAGPHLALVTYAFELYSPNNVPVHVGNFTAPDASGAWTDYTFTEPFPPFQSSVEWSGGPYRLVIKVRDSMSVINSVELLASICRPRGNKAAGGNYGEGKIEVQVDCIGKEARIADRTPYYYQGISGVILPTSTLTVVPPTDPLQPSEPNPPTVFTGFSQAVYPLVITGEGYKVVLQAVVDYAFSPDVTVRLKYVKLQKFDVNCHYDLCPLLCEFAKMIEQADVDCDTRTEKKIARITALLVEAVLAQMKPTCGFDLGKIIDEMKEIGGWQCDCNCSSPVGINGLPMTGGAGDLNIQFTTSGDITAGTPVVNGNNILIDLKDYSYVVSVSPAPASRAFTILPGTSGRVKTFVLSADLELLAEDLLEKIGSVPALVDALNALVQNNFSFTVDGKCVISTRAACDYEVRIDAGVVVAPLQAMFKSITINGVVQPVNIAYNTSLSTLTALAAKLTSLNLGTFTATVANGYLQVFSLNNKNVITSASVWGSGYTTDEIYAVNKTNCSSSVVYTPSEIVQAMIDYMCAIKASQVYLGSNFDYASLDASGNYTLISFKAGDPLSSLIDAIRANQLIQANLNKTFVPMTCATVKGVFADKLATIKPTDYLLGTRDGNCGQWAGVDIVTSVINTIMGSNDQAFLDKWCEALSRCTPAVCSAVSGFTLNFLTDRKENYLIVGNDIVWIGYYTNITLPVLKTLTLTQKSDTGLSGATTTVTVGQNTNRRLAIISTLPALAAGYHWEITGLSPAGATTYLSADILNNSALSYKLAVRIAGATPPAYTFTNYAAQAGQYTRILLALPANNYEGQVIAVCGVGKESTAVTASTTTCPLPEIFSVTRKSTTEFEVTYKFRADVFKYQLDIVYPNAGTYNNVLDVNVSGLQIIPVPPNVYGSYSFKIRAVCDQPAGWYGPYATPIAVNVTAPVDQGCVSVVSIATTLITDTTARITATAPVSVPGSVVSVTLELVDITGEGMTPYTHSVPTDLVWNLTSLIPGHVYAPSVRYNILGQTCASFAGPQFTMLPPAVNTQSVLYGWISDPLGGDGYTNANIAGVVLPYALSVAIGALTYEVPFNNPGGAPPPAPQWQVFIIREPVSAPMKNRYTNGLNSETFGSYTFRPAYTPAVGEEGYGYRYYYTRSCSFDVTDTVHLYTA